MDRHAFCIARRRYYQYIGVDGEVQHADLHSEVLAKWIGRPIILIGLFRLRV